MNTNKTDITMIMDASGSMDGFRQEQAVNGYNEFIQEQKKGPGECYVSLFLFNTEIEPKYDGKPIQDVPTLKIDDYKCDGQTAINDALGLLINQLGDRLRDMPEEDRPGKVIVVVLTDGEENASQEFTYQKVKEMMDHQRDVYSWNFIIMGSNEINASPDGNFAGMAGVRGPCGPKGLMGDIGLDGVMTKMFSASSAAVMRFRTGQAQEVAYSDAEENDADLKTVVQA